MVVVCRVEVEVVIFLSPFKYLCPEFASTCSTPRIAGLRQTALSGRDQWVKMA
jgi:hypothetical protein